jgi:hypothetical protein
MRRPMVMAVVLGAAAALAQDSKPELAPFPLEIIRTADDCTAADQDELRTLWPMMLRAAGSSVPDSAKLSGALRDLGRQDCNRDDACLAQLGRLAGSLYAVYGQVDFDLDRNVVASGRVVRDDGRAVRGPKTVKLPLGAAGFKVAAQAALKQLLVELDVAQLPPFRPQEPVAELEPAPLPEPVLGAVAVPSKRPALGAAGVVGIIGIGTGAACVLLGTVLLATTAPPHSEVSQGVVRVFSEDASKVASIQRAQAVGVAALAVGAGLAAVGAGLAVFGAEKPSATVLPITGGAALLLSGSLP